MSPVRVAPSRYFTCCCQWSFVIGAKRVFGPYYPDSDDDFRFALAGTARMMSREEFADLHSDCAACLAGEHHHAP